MGSVRNADPIATTYDTSGESVPKMDDGLAVPQRYQTSCRIESAFI